MGDASSCFPTRGGPPKRETFHRLLEKMKYIFFGTPEFAAIILEKLINARLSPVALVCNPDKPVGRKKIISSPPSKEIVLRKQLSNIDILQPSKLDTEFLEKLRSYDVDFYVVAAYAKILGAELIKIPKLGIIGVHPSLLPKFRGPSPIQSAILAGTKETGVTLFLLDEKVDHGPIIGQKIYSIQQATNYEELSKKLAELSGDLLVETLHPFVERKIKPSEQNHSQATFTRKFVTEDGYVDIKELKNAVSGLNPKVTETIDRKIRAFNPEPSVYTFINNKRTKLLSSTVENGRLVLKEIQFEGKCPIRFLEYQQPLS